MKRKTKLLASLCLSAMAMTFLFGTQRKSNFVPEPIKIAGTENSKAPQGKTAYTPLDEYYSSNQYISMNHLGNIENVWDYYKGEGIRVGVIDTAFDWDHPDFIDENNESLFDCENGQFIMHCTQDTSQEATYNYNYYGGIVIFNVPKTGYYQIDGQKLYGNDLLKPTTDETNANFNHHGTNVASTLASINHQTKHTGTVGVAPKVKIVPFKTDLRFDCVAKALEHIGDLNEDDDSSNDIQVVNMSIQGDSTWNAMETQITRLINQDVIVIAAAGNHSTSTKYYPASCPGVIGVGALAKDSSTSLASYSNYNAAGNTSISNNNVDLVAPGSVYAASWKTSGHTYTETQGTSFASPIVAGAAALWKQRNPSGTVNEFKSDLWNSCVDIGTSGWDTTFGYGRLDIEKLVNKVSVTGVTISEQSLELNLDAHQTSKLTATVQPIDATNKEVLWMSSNESVATVDQSGVVTPVGVGECDVTVTTDDGYFEASCHVKVVKSTTKNYLLGWGSASGTTGTYTNFSATNGSVENLLSFTSAQNSAGSAPAVSSSQLRLYYNKQGNGGSVTITPTSSTTITGFELVCAKDSNNTPTIGYKVGGGTQTTLTASNVTYTASGFSSTSSAPLTIQNVNTTNVQLRISTLKIFYIQVPYVTSIEVETSPEKTNYTVGDFFDPSGLILRRNYSDSSHDSYAYSGHESEFSFTPSLNTALTTSVSYVSITLGNFSTSQSITVEKGAITGITASVTKTYYVGQSIVKSDITVRDSNDDQVTDFTFDSYQFTFSDASSGGALTNKEFSVTYLTFTANFTVKVQRKAYESTTGDSDFLTRETTGVSSGSSSYSGWNGKSVSSKAVYAGKSAGGYNSIQIRSSDSDSGIVTTSSGGMIKKIIVVWQSNTSDGRTLNVYGKSSAYSNPSELFNSSNQGTLLGTIVKGTSTELTIDGSYSFVGVRSASGAMYLTSITFSYGGDETPTNIANYIMYEDTNGQCADVGTTKGKFSIACNYFGTLTKQGRVVFMESTDYVISTARERFIKWAAYHHKTIKASGDDYIITPSIQNQILMDITSNSPSIIVIVASIICLSALGGYIYIRKRKEQ